MIRCNYVWRLFVTFRMFPHCWRTKADFSVFPSEWIIFQASFWSFDKILYIFISFSFGGRKRRKWLVIEKYEMLNVQCAHGRPTTVPLVNLEALHKQLRELEVSNKNGSNGTWHGLQQHELSLERTLQRLSSAEGL